MSQTTLCRNFGGKEGGGRTFEGGVLAGHYGICSEVFLKYCIYCVSAPFLHRRVYRLSDTYNEIST